MKRHLVIDARFVRRFPTGIGNAILRQLEGLDILLGGEVGSRWEVTAIRLSRELDDPTFPDHWESLKHIHFVESWADPTSHPVGEWWLHTRLPRLLRDMGADVFYGPAYTAPMWVPRGVGRMVMFHDDLAWSHPESYPRKFREFIRLQMRMSVLSAERLIFPSHAACGSCQRRLGIDKSRVGVVHHGLSARTGGVVPLSGREDLVVCVASAELRKNQIVLARALSGRQAPGLVLVGYSPRSTAQLEEIRALRAPLEIVPVASQSQVDSWLSRAAIFALPTEGEGFGLPVIEAMAAGTPLLLSDIPIMREVAGDAAVYLPPRSPRAWAEGIDALLADESRREEMVAKGLERIKNYSLENCAMSLLREAEQVVKVLGRKRTLVKKNG
ncbi:MAG: glycosyltransferase family 4 protein [Candidatus Sumerlaeia bacterium]|nr:glycosyltransferase family 4 protein [Candidatus Sumerlaeia bacterium]